MKYPHILITGILCMFFLAPLSAQGYTPPSQELVEQLLQQINDCKKEAEALREFLKTDLGIDAFLKYDEFKKNRYRLEEVEECIRKTREQLDKLRKDYPGWFNAPNATVTVHDRDQIAAKDLEKKLEELTPFGKLINDIYKKHE